jgi:ABC-type nitrate/sulfonate/bicarbonate transport system permease component
VSISADRDKAPVDQPARKALAAASAMTWSSALERLTRRRVAEDRSQPLSRVSRAAYGSVAIVVAIAGWQLLSGTHAVNTLLVSSPVDIVKAAVSLNNSGVLGSSVWETTKVFFISFGLSLVIGIGLGILIGWYRRLGALLDPIVSMLYAAPRVALLPLIVAWTGIGDEAQIVTVLTIAVFPILVNVQAGVSTVDKNLVQVARTYLGTNFDVLRTIALPACIPHLISGVRQGLAQALLGVVIAEYLIGSTGIGGLIVSAGQTLNFSNAFVGVFVVSFAALLLTSALRWVERRLDHWRV